MLTVFVELLEIFLGLTVGHPLVLVYIAPHRVLSSSASAGGITCGHGRTAEAAPREI